MERYSHRRIEIQNEELLIAWGYQAAWVEIGPTIWTQERVMTFSLKLPRYWAAHAPQKKGEDSQRDRPFFS